MSQVDTVATTLTLAEQNHAEELKRVCLEFASRNLSTVMCSEGYHHMISSCPQLQVLTHSVNQSIKQASKQSLITFFVVKTHQGSQQTVIGKMGAA